MTNIEGTLQRVVALEAKKHSLWHSVWLSVDFVVGSTHQLKSGHQSNELLQNIVKTQTQPSAQFN